ncbi:MAG: hypothetical protein WA210_09945, partial [Burkholderiaceae bacterium]
MRFVLDKNPSIRCAKAAFAGVRAWRYLAGWAVLGLGTLNGHAQVPPSPTEVAQYGALHAAAHRGAAGQL